jgi:erythromycin esterase-like protein
MDQMAAEVAAAARPLTGGPGDHDDLLARIGDRRIVLLGEASHGTHDFYAERIRLTKRLIEEKGFNAVAVEADWPDAYRVNRFVMGRSDDTDARAALSDFRRFPAWMWRNEDVAGFVQWLQAHNVQARPLRDKVRFYGLDLYSLRASMDAVVRYLDHRDRAAAAAARLRYSCFDHVGGEGQEYGHAVALNLKVPCEDEVVAELIDLQRASSRLLANDGFVAEDEFFFAEQNARVVHNAERYYREMYRGRVSSWNLRDLHMGDTLEALVRHLDRQHGRTKVVVWEHNSHLGDARATEMGTRGELNVGQLARSRWGDNAVLIGFTTHHGEVTAASDWGGPAERKTVRPALPGSYEDLFHRSGVDRFSLLTRGPIAPVLRDPRLERAIGVIYRPETERVSHWFHASLSEQFDAVIHLDETSAVVPLERTSQWDEGEAPETYPTGF